MDGVINLLKAPGMTSHDCVSSIRRLLGEKRIGHTGTLDPAACGVLPICIGRATRLSEYALDYIKSYRAEMILGISSDTQDITGKILKHRKAVGITEEKIRDALTKFCGSMEQVVPAYSAVKVGGRKLYELAREGLEVPQKRRRVIIYSISLFRFYPSENPRVIIDVRCSKGTYVRTLCADIGEFLGTGAVISFLVRTSSGPFLLKDSLTLDEIKGFLKTDDHSFIQPMAVLVRHLPLAAIDAVALKYIKNGVPVKSGHFEVFGDFKESSAVRIMYENELVGIGTIHFSSGSYSLKPKKVLI